VIQIQPRQASVEISAAGDDDVDTRGSHGGAIFVRINKCGCTTLRHAQNLIRRATLPQTAIAKSRGWEISFDPAMLLRKFARNFRSSVPLKLGLSSMVSIAKGALGCCIYVSQGNDRRILPFLHSVF
jgi:hypothetical protein